MKIHFYFFSRLHSILSKIREKDEIRLRAVFCVMTLCGSDSCIRDEGSRFHGIVFNSVTDYTVLEPNLHQLQTSYYKLRKSCEILGSHSDGTEDSVEIFTSRHGETFQVILNLRTDCECSRLYACSLQRTLQKEISYASFHGGVWGNELDLRSFTPVGPERLPLGSDLMHGPCGPRPNPSDLVSSFTSTMTSVEQNTTFWNVSTFRANSKAGQPGSGMPPQWILPQTSASL
jgi:hypothetical protein